MFASLNVYLKNRFCGQVSWESERNRKPELAPMYDAASTLVYPDLSRDFAMSIGGEMSVDRIERKNFEALAEACGMSPKLFLARLDALATRIIATAEGLSKQLDSAWPCPVYGEILKVVAAQVEAFHKQTV